jgi:uncharacterized protein
MTTSLYSATVPVFLQHLPALANCLEKGAQFAAAKKIDQSVLLGLRLYPDMFELARQVRQATNHACGAIRVAGAEPPKFADQEKTVEELKARIQIVCDQLTGLIPTVVNGNEAKEITLTFGQNSRTFKNGAAYLLHFAMPNFYFHTTSAYAILRSIGVEVGKRDFMGTPPA